ncbi:MAG: AAA family ATPase [Eubacteriales bacterium]|nr:AAA family ATPase [Eubacteriales bacterium]
MISPDFFKKLESEILRLKQSAKDLIIIAIDGSSAAGKSTLAADLSARFNAQLFHIDDYFLTTEQRTEERLALVGEFFDKERLLTEVLEPLRVGEEAVSRRFDCSSQSFSEPQLIPGKRIVIVEGVYSLHPDLQKYYDLKIFLYVERQEQLRRLRQRNPEKLDLYLYEWLPREEAYFKKYNFPEANRVL